MLAPPPKPLPLLPLLARMVNKPLHTMHSPKIMMARGRRQRNRTVSRVSTTHATSHTTRIPPFEIRFLTSLSLLFNDFLDFLVLVVVVLTRVGDFVLEDLDELVEDDSDDGAGCGADPVDPVFGVEDAGHDAGAEGAGGVERAAGVVDANEFCDEESEADADGGDEGCWKVLVGVKGRMMR